ncbi:asparagine--tRNA ligase [Candidatus Falkowbacteria bacterium]|nr:asparagine--tRNA ligase [Candidatus Falkowbacteria bacterium]
MTSILVSQLAEYSGQSVSLKGWIFNFRSSGGLYFLQFRDGTGFVQAVVEKSGVSEAVWGACEQVTMESSVALSGTVSEHPKKPGVFELRVDGLKIIQRASEYPIAKKEHGPDFLLDHRHLWLRSPRQWAIQRIRDAVITAIYAFYHQRGFIKIDTPIITPNACEGATELFGITYFDEGQAYLSQSGQLYLEAAIMSVGRGFDFGPTFRAEKSKTRRHLTEFWMMDAEAAFVEHEDSMKLQEEMICAIVEHCLMHCQQEFTILERDTTPLKKIKAPFTRLTYTEAIKKLNELGSDIKFGEDLGNDDEGLLTRDSSVPVFVHKWPASIKPFYMKVDPANPDLVLNDDLIGTAGAGELIGGSQREDDYEILKSKIEAEGLQGEEYQWYLDLRKYGSVPHSGFGLGLERTVGWIAGAEHIRETIPFPRLINRFKP